jgi:hypothetical protein
MSSAIATGAAGAGAGDVLYEVALEVQPAIASALEAYMRDKHLPEIMATGCFKRIVFQHAHELSGAAAGTSAATTEGGAERAPVRMRTTYVAASAAELERYLREHQAAMKADFVAHFPSGAVPSRQVWQNVSVLER